MSTYTFTAPAHAAGSSYEIINGSNVVVATGTVPAESTGPGEIQFAVELEAGTYSLRGPSVSSSQGAKYAGVVAPDAPGAAETAYLIATGPVYLADGNGAAGNLNFTADDRQGDLPAWVSLASGDVVLGEDAGTCAFALKFQTDFDFTGETPPDGSGLLGDYVTITLDGNALNTPTGLGSDADGENAQSSTLRTIGGLAVGSALIVGYAPSADGNVGDATPRVALTITRLAPAPTLPA